MVDGMATTTAAAVAVADAVACALFMTPQGNHTGTGAVKGNYPACPVDLLRGLFSLWE